MKLLGAILAIGTALAVFVGWYCNTEWLVMWGGGVSTKPLTAATFLFTATALLFANTLLEHVSLSIATCVGIFMIGAVTEFSFNHAWFVPEPHHWDDLSVSPGVPSIATCFLAWSWIIAGYFRTPGNRHPKMIRVAEILTIIVCAVALVGHALMWTIGVNSFTCLLIFYIPGLSTGLAIPTAVSFLGTVLIAGAEMEARHNG